MSKVRKVKVTGGKPQYHWDEPTHTKLLTRPQRLNRWQCQVLTTHLQMYSTRNLQDILKMVIPQELSGQLTCYEQLLAETSQCLLSLDLTVGPLGA